MAIPSFFHPLLSSGDSSIALSADEAMHAVKSRRLKVGSEVRLFNGQGLVGRARITVAARREVIADIIQLEQADRPKYELTVAVAVPKGDRQKVMLDMLTQLGVSGIIPLRCKRSVTQFGDNMAAKWRRVMIEACKQSQNPWLPELGDELGLDDLLMHKQRIFAYADAVGDDVRKVFTAASGNTILIGPEGGFSETEFAAMQSLGIPALSLGGHILRTEAAAVTAAAQYNGFRSVLG